MKNKTNETIDIKAINEKIEKESAFVDLLTLEMNKVIVGQKHMVERLLIGLWYDYLLVTVYPSKVTAYDLSNSR